MGCWNETDALTQLPILSGDPVKLIVVSSTPDGSALGRGNYGQLEHRAGDLRMCGISP